MHILPLLLAAATFALPAAAQQPGVPAPEQAQAQGQTGSTLPLPTVADVRDIRVNQLVIFEGDTCPQSRDTNEVTICVTAPAGQRFRIPPNLREDPNPTAGESWTNRAIALSYVGRSGTGSCSPDGPGGFLGCSQQLINQAVAERRGRPEVNWARLIEQARQERLGQIGAQSAQAEQAAEGDRRTQELRLREGQTCPPSTQAVIIVCTLPDGRPAPNQAPGEPVFPVGSGGRATNVPSTPTPRD